VSSERGRVLVEFRHAESDMARAARILSRFGPDSRQGRAAAADLEAARENKRRAQEKLDALEVTS
jgi:hypothetical protein